MSLKNLRKLFKATLLIVNVVILAMVAIIGIQTFRVVEAQDLLERSIVSHVPARSIRQNLSTFEATVNQFIVRF